MSETTIAKFVARSVINDGGATDRLAQAFQTLVRDSNDRTRLLGLAQDDVAASPLGSTQGFEAVWNGVARKLLTTYEDESFVSEAYASELSLARTRAIPVDQINDDPPERIAVWLSSVSTSATRALDLTLLVDLLRIEEDDGHWATLMQPVGVLLDDLLLVGDFDAASQLLGELVREAGGRGSTGRRQAAMNAIDQLVAGSMMRHVVSHLATIDDAQFECVKTMCVSLGEVVVRPLAEALSTEGRVRTRERLTAIMLGFGAAGRRCVERLKASPEELAAAQKLGVDLGLSELLNDNEPGVQREAVRAILTIGTNRAYQVLEQALVTASDQTRNTIMQAVGLVRDERATGLFAYVLRHVDHRRLTAIYLRAIESLGALRDPEGVEPLKEALYRGEWWAPWRTARLRAAAAAALARIGTPEALAVLEEASQSASRHIRAAVRPQTRIARSRAARAAGR